MRRKGASSTTIVSFFQRGGSGKCVAAVDFALQPGASEDPAETGIVSWTPPAPTLTAPMALITDVVEIAVYNSEAGPVLIGAIELVSPANKDRPETRDAFVSKCASYLQQAIGLIVVDLVTNRKADLHAEVLRRVIARDVPPSDLWAAAYRPTQSGDQTSLEIWHEP